MGLCIGTCTGCGGMVRTRTPQRTTDKGLYHDHCYFREKEKEDAGMPNVSKTTDGGFLSSTDTGREV